jgi:hypothetical protein
VPEELIRAALRRDGPGTCGPPAFLQAIRCPRRDAGAGHPDNAWRLMGTWLKFADSLRQNRLYTTQHFPPLAISCESFVVYRVGDLKEVGHSGAQAGDSNPRAKPIEYDDVWFFPNPENWTSVYGN